MKRSRSPSPNDVSAPKRRRSLVDHHACPTDQNAPDVSLTAANNIPKPDEPPQSRAEYWDPVIKQLSILRRSNIPQMGGLHLVDVRLGISKDNRTPPEFNPTKEQLSSLTHHFGNDVIEQLDAL
jgi:hypothetical protein